LNILKQLIAIFKSDHPKSTPLIIIKSEIDDYEIKEYRSIEEVLAELENDPNVSKAKIEKLRSSLKNLKNKTVIKIRNGEIIESSTNKEL